MILMLVHVLMKNDAADEWWWSWSWSWAAADNIVGDNPNDAVDAAGVLNAQWMSLVFQSDVLNTTDTTRSTTLKTQLNNEI